jgi:integrative and conjugative element protein (TIGR02256 family)
MKIEIAPEVVARLRQALRNAGRREIGGMMFAEQLAPGSFRLIAVSLDPLSGSSSHFRRDPGAHQKALTAFFEETGRDYGRYNYLGEWHSHPSYSVSPSTEDMETMQMLVDDETSVITFAFLLIVRQRFRFWIDHSFTLFVRGVKPQKIKSRF